MASDVSISPARAEEPLVLALDIGTSSVRAVFFDRMGRILEDCMARHPVALLTSPDGTAIIEADALFATTCRCVDEALTALISLQLSEALPIVGVGICSFVSNVLGVDSDGGAITPIFTYADTRPARDMAALQTIADEGAVHQRTGCHFHPSYLPARFIWLARTQPELLRMNLRWMSFGEFLILRLFGETSVSYSTASWSGLLDRHQMAWDQELLRILPINLEQLSPLVDVDQPWRGLRQDFLRRWPALKDVPWFPSIGDGAAANLGSGCISRDKLALTLGTSTALRVVLSDDISVIPEGLWCYRVDHNDSLLGAAMSEGGSVFDWLQSILRLEEISQLEADLRAMPPDAHGLTFLPLISGERSPGWVAEARGAILGLSQATKPADIVRAALEGVAIRILLVYELLRAALPDQPRIIASGGAIQHSLAWAQIIADALGQTITLSGNPEASARGVAMLGFRSLGIAADLQEFPFLTGRSFQPDMRHYEIYQAAFERQQVLYNHVIENLQSSNPKKNNYC